MGMLADPWDILSLQAKPGGDTTGQVAPVMPLLSITAGKNSSETYLYSGDQKWGTLGSSAGL